MSQVICPICGKFFSVRHYDPSDFADDILLVQVRGLGRGKGVEVVEKYSLLDGSNPELLDMISDRVAVIYDLLYEDVEDDEAEDVEDEYARAWNLFEMRCVHAQALKRWSQVSLWARHVREGDAMDRESAIHTTDVPERAG